jgi:hypothetical protein
LPTIGKAGKFSGWWRWWKGHTPKYQAKNLSNAQSLTANIKKRAFILYVSQFYNDFDTLTHTHCWNGNAQQKSFIALNIHEFVLFHQKKIKNPNTKMSENHKNWLGKVFTPFLSGCGRRTSIENGAIFHQFEYEILIIGEFFMYFSFISLFHYIILF